MREVYHREAGRFEAVGEQVYFSPDDAQV